MIQKKKILFQFDYSLTNTNLSNFQKEKKIFLITFQCDHLGKFKFLTVFVFEHCYSAFFLEISIKLLEGPYR